MTRRMILVLACLGLGAQTQTPLDIPSTLASYRSWQPLSGSARPVSLPVSTLCALVPPGELQRRVESARKQYGPHAERYVRAFANPVAVETLLDPNAKQFRPGAVMAKEKLKARSDDSPEGVAFMVKHPDGMFVDSGGWEFQYYPRSGDGSTAACAECHRAGAPVDYVFGSLSQGSAGSKQVGYVQEER